MIVHRDPTPTADMVEKARLALKANIERREKKGHVVRVLKGPYHENLRNIRRVLEIDGARTRMVYLPKRGRWSTARGPILRPEIKRP
jgi:hypothetical protein